MKHDSLRYFLVLFVFLMIGANFLGADSAPIIASTRMAVSKDTTPVWIGYVNRSGAKGKGEGPEWMYIIRLSGGTTETVRRGGATSDGWRVVEAATQANKPGTITVEKDGIQKVLKLTPGGGTTGQ